MTPQEQQMLQDLTDRINKTQLTEKDPEAERFIFQALGRNSDSLYIMAQTILVQQYALDQAKKQLDDAKQQVDDLGQQLEQARQQPQKHTSFLGSLLGTDDSHSAPPPPPPVQYNQQQYQPVQNYAPPPPQYGQPASVWTAAVWTAGIWWAAAFAVWGWGVSAVCNDDCNRRCRGCAGV